jgi:hypothetical protein
MAEAKRNRRLLFARLIAQSHRPQPALTPGPIPCLFGDCQSQTCCESYNSAIIMAGLTVFSFRLRSAAKE